MLSKSYINKGLVYVAGCKFFGMPVEDMTKEELLAAFGHAQKELSDTREAEYTVGRKQLRVSKVIYKRLDQ